MNFGITGRRNLDDFYALCEKQIKVGKTTQLREKEGKMRSQSSFQTVNENVVIVVYKEGKFHDGNQKKLVMA